MQPLGSVFSTSLNDVHGFLIITIRQCLSQIAAECTFIHHPSPPWLFEVSDMRDEISSHSKLMSEHCSAIHRFIFNTYCLDKKIIKSIKIPYPYAFQPSVLYIYIYTSAYIHLYIFTHKFTCKSILDANATLLMSLCKENFATTGTCITEFVRL